MYHRFDNAKRTFSYVDNRIWQMIWKWALRRHRNKGKRWIKQRYFRTYKEAIGCYLIMTRMAT